MLRSSENSRVLKTVIKNSISGVDPLLHTPTLFLHLPSLFSLPSLSPLCHMYQETHGSRPGAVVVHYSRFSKGRPVTHKPGGVAGPLVGWAYLKDKITHWSTGDRRGQGMNTTKPASSRERRRKGRSRRSLSLSECLDVTWLPSLSISRCGYQQQQQQTALNASKCSLGSWQRTGNTD